jgi:hypothetical protein
LREQDTRARARIDNFDFRINGASIAHTLKFRSQSGCALKSIL